MAIRSPLIDADRCSGCGRCIAACEPRLFAFEQLGWRKISVLQDMDPCTGCGKCAIVCPITAITMHKKARVRPPPRVLREAGLTSHCSAA